MCVECLESVGHVLTDDVLLEAEQTVELLMSLSTYETQWRLSSPTSLQQLMVSRHLLDLYLLYLYLVYCLRWNQLIVSVYSMLMSLISSQLRTFILVM